MKSKDPDEFNGPEPKAPGFEPPPAAGELLTWLKNFLSSLNE